jgi:hypothetical protein
MVEGDAAEAVLAGYAARHAVHPVLGQEADALMVDDLETISSIESLEFNGHVRVVGECSIELDVDGESLAALDRKEV